MGYQTLHTLVVDEDYDKHVEGLRAISGYSCLFEDTCKWYDLEKDVSEYSKMHPNVLFAIYGEGEEYSDLWVHYFKNGMSQFEPAVITYDPPSVDLLAGKGAGL